MLIGLVLMITALVILYRCARGKSRRQRMNELADTLLSIHDSLELQVRRLETLSGEIASDNEKCSALQYRIGLLQDTVDSLEYRRDELDRDNQSMTRTNNELKRSNAELVEKAARLRDSIAHDEQAICEAEQSIDLLKRIKEGLEIAMSNIPAEEVPYLHSRYSAWESRRPHRTTSPPTEYNISGTCCALTSSICWRYGVSVRLR